MPLLLSMPINLSSLTWEFERTSTSQNFTPSCTILHQLSSLEQQITTAQSTLSIYILTLQRRLCCYKPQGWIGTDDNLAWAEGEDCTVWCNCGMVATWKTPTTKWATTNDSSCSCPDDKRAICMSFTWKNCLWLWSKRFLQYTGHISCTSWKPKCVSPGTAIHCVSTKIEFWPHLCFPQDKVVDSRSPGLCRSVDIPDVVHARCKTTTQTGQQLLARFDTALIDVSSGSSEDDYCGVEGASESS